MDRARGACGHEGQTGGADNGALMRHPRGLRQYSLQAQCRCSATAAPLLEVPSCTSCTSAVGCAAAGRVPLPSTCRCCSTLHCGCTASEALLLTRLLPLLPLPAAAPAAASHRSCCCRTPPLPLPLLLMPPLMPPHSLCLCSRLLTPGSISPQPPRLSAHTCPSTPVLPAPAPAAQLPLQTRTAAAQTQTRPAPPRRTFMYSSW